MRRVRLSRTQRGILVAVIALHAGGSISMRSVAERLGLASPSSVFSTLQRLRYLGVVSWEPKIANTLRPHPDIVLIGGEPYLAERL